MKRIALLTGAALMAATAASAQTLAPAAAAAPAPAKTTTPGTPPADRAAGGHGKINFMDTYDTNGDASVPKAEYVTQRTKDYTRTAEGKDSVNEDQYVNEFAVRLDRQLAETRAGQIKQAHVRFGVLDTNKDGKISEAEYMASGDKMFSALDTNKDGVVDEKDTKEEF